ncbi:MAG: radical SAM protein [Candidatus Saganbacteria bacterium]|nr:radical SAM protein [Candidatus Saganbacteria bacterium]
MNAAGILNGLGRQKATLLVTSRCNLSCKHCFNPKQVQPRDMDPDIARQAVDQLTGLPQLYYSLGEPFLYMGNTQEFMDLLHYSAKRVGQCLINTSGALFPREKTGIRSYFSEFPANTTFVLSIDHYHAKSLSKEGINIKDLFNLTYTAAQVFGFGLEINMRFPKDSIRRNSFLARKIAIDLGIDLDIFDRMDRAGLVHANTVQAQNKAQNLPDEDTIFLRVQDLFDHNQRLSDIGVFINTQGLVINNVHAAFMQNPHPLSILGDLRQESLTEIFARGFSRKDYGLDDVVSALTDLDKNTNWVLDVSKKAVLEAFGKEAEELVIRFALEYVNKVLTGYDFPLSVVNFFIRSGRLEYHAWHTPPESIASHMKENIQVIFGLIKHTYIKLGREIGFENAKRLLLTPIYNFIRENRIEIINMPGNKAENILMLYDLARRELGVKRSFKEFCQHMAYGI